MWVVGEQLGRFQNAGWILGIAAGEQQAGDLASGRRGRRGERVDPARNLPPLRREGHAQPFADPLAEGGGASGTPIGQLAVESSDHSARVIPGQGGEDSGQWAFLHGSDLVGSSGRTHVRRISMWCWWRTAPP